ncbi:hypothetical protein MGYG_04024 [Nannizzia gypsea CBS 118893]|uniref:Uncharacterized protein n=1 Tax=Arthroderma gypseum (strain ATCC MYA-4604 / CBS 118893) TaxID=535722 RepID=E4UUQ4_ARTGP|nr:hypothetical protein MGYG_04024 [Nannizzia gypsea CBS 118893]EFR01021.1 hypothetical protein MGYG_04024 [Nannizzia gypsea CBS 118893]
MAACETFQPLQVRWALLLQLLLAEIARISARLLHALPRAKLISLAPQKHSPRAEPRLFLRVYLTAGNAVDTIITTITCEVRPGRDT